MDARPSIVLNANQRRHFEVLFARLEESLGKVEALLATEATRQPTLSVSIDDVPPDFRATAGPVLADLRNEVARLSGALELRPRTLSRSRSIAATLNTEAIRIEDSLSSQLRGYGEVHPSMAQQLDPILEKMAVTLDSLSVALRPRNRSHKE